MRTLRSALVVCALLAGGTAGADAQAATFCISSPGCAGIAASSIADAATKSNAVNDGTTDVIKVGPGT